MNRQGVLDRQPLAFLLDLNQVAFAAAFVLYLLTILLEPRLGEDVPRWMNPGNILWATVGTGVVFILTRWKQAQEVDRLGRRTEWMLLVAVCVGAWAFMWQVARDLPWLLYGVAGFTAFLVGFAGYAYLGPGSKRVDAADALEEAVERRRSAVSALPQWRRGPEAGPFLVASSNDEEVTACPRCQLRARHDSHEARSGARLQCPRCRAVVRVQVNL